MSAAEPDTRSLHARLPGHKGAHPRWYAVCTIVVQESTCCEKRSSGPIASQTTAVPKSTSPRVQWRGSMVTADSEPMTFPARMSGTMMSPRNS